MVNKDPSYDISDKLAPIHYDTVTSKAMSEHDLQTMTELIEAVNSKGYYIQYYFQLGAMDLSCRDLFEVIKNYVWKFDDPLFSIRLIAYLGVPKLYEATPFLIDAFKREKQHRLGKPNNSETTRASAASSLLLVRDGRYQETYRDLINDEKTHNDSCFLVTLLGYFESPENYELILKLLSDENLAVRNQAINALGRYKTYALPSMELLEDIIQQSISRDAVREAKKSLAKLQKYYNKTASRN